MSRLVCLTATGMSLIAVTSGCRLVDQRTFQPAGQAPEAAQLTRPDLPALPLLAIRFPADESAWRPLIVEAVRSAQARKPGVVFQIVTPVPISASAETQSGYEKAGTAYATLVANAMLSEGVAPERVHIGLRSDPGSPPLEVRVYVQ